MEVRLKLPLQMILPLHEIIAVQKAKPLRFDYSGIVLIVRGHEELFFEIGSVRKRDDLLSVIGYQIQSSKAVLGQDLPPASPTQELDELEALRKAPSSPKSPSESSQIMFGSGTSSFVTFEPVKRLHSKLSSIHNNASTLLLNCSQSLASQ